MFHFHKWSPWLTVEQGKVVDYHRSNNQIGKYLIQECYCVKCDKTQNRTSATCSLMPSNHIQIPEVRKTLPKHDKVN